MTGIPTYHAFLKFLIKDAGAMLAKKTEKSVILVEYSVKTFHFSLHAIITCKGVK